MAAFYHSVTGDQYFISGARKERGCIIADSKGYPLRPDPLPIQEIADPPDEPKLSDVTYPLRHVG